HRVARDQVRQLGLAQAFGPGGTLWENQVAELRARVPDADLHALGQVDAELVQHHARLTHRPRAVLERLVPDRREADESMRIAGAERANDQIVYSGRVLDHLEVDPAEAQLFDRRGPVGEEALAVRRIDPGAGVEADAVERVGLLALSVSVGVRKDEGPVHAGDDAGLAARVAGQPRVSHRRVVAREDAISCREARRRSGLAVASALPRGPQHA